MLCTSSILIILSSAIHTTAFQKKSIDISDIIDEALERYNTKQTRADRKIENYYEKIRNSKQEKPFHELILQIGDKELSRVKSAVESAACKSDGALRN